MKTKEIIDFVEEIRTQVKNAIATGKVDELKTLLSRLRSAQQDVQGETQALRKAHNAYIAMKMAEEANAVREEFASMQDCLSILVSNIECLNNCIKAFQN